MKRTGAKKVELRCPACGRDAWLKRTTRYDGFTAVGETLSCALCGHEFASEDEIDFKGDATPGVFTDADRPRAVKVCDEEYVVNHFLHRCGLHKCEVEATDTCPHFHPKPPPEEKEEPPAPDPFRL